MWWKDFCWDSVERRFPHPREMAHRLESLGASDDSILVLIGDPIQFATYAYWVLSMAGLDDVATVLDGGRQALERASALLTHDDPPMRERGSITLHESNPTLKVGRDNVLAGLANPNRVLLDLRSIEEYSGARVSPATVEFDHGAERSGRIPGAVHFPHERLLTEDGTFCDADEITELLEGAGAGEHTDVIAYCRLSHRAALGWFVATKLVGRSNVRVYDGSWTEWGSAVALPIEW